MSSLIADVLNGAVTPGVCNAAVNAGGKLLKVVEMQQRYGVLTGNSTDKQLVLCPDETRESRLARLQNELTELRA